MRRVLVLVLMASMLTSCAAFLPYLKDAGTTLGKCLAGAGVEMADDLVTEWHNNEQIDASRIPWDILIRATPCLIQSGAVLFAGFNAMAEDSEFDSVGASMTPQMRILQEEDPIRAACGHGERPNCYFILMKPAMGAYLYGN